jgi:aminoglycoside 3-N-acetyltransferase
VSFAAWGRHADVITANHALDDSLGESSPLARIYDLDGYVLLLGVNYRRNTSFHLAEYRAPGSELVVNGAPILENGQRVWKTYFDIDLNADIFSAIGLAFEQSHRVAIGQVGSAECRLFAQKTAVDFAQAWLTKYHRRIDD